MIKFTVKNPPPLRSQAAKSYVLQRAKNGFGKIMEESVTKITSGWKGEQPGWKKSYRSTSKGITVTLAPANEESYGAKKWRWLDEGTKPHSIPKEGTTFMAFPSGFSPGSVPNVLATMPNAYFGDTVYARHVNHPGVAPRNWSDTVMETWQDRFVEFMTPVLKEAANISGHGGG